MSATPDGEYKWILHNVLFSKISSSFAPRSKQFTRIWGQLRMGGQLAALKAKLQEVGYGEDGDMVVGAVIAPEVMLT